MSIHEFDLNEVYHQVFGYVSTPFPSGNIGSALTPSNPLNVINIVKDQFYNEVGGEQVMPLRIGIPGEDRWDMPIEPLISVGGGHKVIRRFPNRSSEESGSIKERWSGRDKRIRIRGVIMDLEGKQYPEEDVRKLYKYAKHAGVLEVQCALFTILGIDRIAIERFEIVATRGIASQRYSITGYSDKLFNALLIDS